MGLASSHHVHSDSRPGRTDGPQPRRRHERFAKAAATTTRKPRPCNVKARTPAHCTGVLQARRASRLSALSTGYSPAPLQHGSVGCRARVERPVGSVGRVGKMRPARCSASPSQRPARPRAPWDHLLHLPWAEAASPPCVTVKGHRTRWRQWPVAWRCSWWIRALL